MLNSMVDTSYWKLATAHWLHYKRRKLVSSLYSIVARPELVCYARGLRALLCLSPLKVRFCWSFVHHVFLYACNIRLFSFFFLFVIQPFWTYMNFVLEGFSSSGSRTEPKGDIGEVPLDHIELPILSVLSLFIYSDLLICLSSCHYTGVMCV